MREIPANVHRLRIPSPPTTAAVAGAGEAGGDGGDGGYGGGDGAGAGSGNYGISHRKCVIRKLIIPQNNNFEIYSVFNS